MAIARWKYSIALRAPSSVACSRKNLPRRHSSYAGNDAAVDPRSVRGRCSASVSECAIFIATSR